MLVQLVYVSLATSEMGLEELVDLLDESRARNRQRGLTGLLLYSGGNIVQVLEGPAEEVDALFGVISADPRHTRVRAVWREPVDHRVFSDWSMGFRELSPEEAQGVEGYSDFLRTGSMAGLEATSDPSLAALHAFRRTTA